MPSSRRASSTGASSSARWAITSVSPRERSSWPRRASSLAQLAEVVDLAVEDDGDGAVLVRDRRIAGDEVDDREAVLGDHRAAAGEAAARVRAAVLERAELRVDDRAGDRPGSGATTPQMPHISRLWRGARRGSSGPR